MKNAFLTLLDHIISHIVQLLTIHAKKIQKSISLYFYIEIQSYFLPEKQNMTRA